MRARQHTQRAVSAEGFCGCFMSCMRRIPVLLTRLFCLSSEAARLQPGDTVDNFRLIDHTGKSHELYYLSDMKAVVLVAYSAECDVSGKVRRHARNLRSRRSQDVAVLMIDSNLNDSREAIAQAAAKAGFTLPILMDETQVIGESLGFTRNGEALVLNPKGWKVAYHGAAADALGRSRRCARRLTSRSKIASTDAVGCAIAMPEREQALRACADLV